jgi:hypothetical protein
MMAMACSPSPRVYAFALRLYIKKSWPALRDKPGRQVGNQALCVCNFCLKALMDSDLTPILHFIDIDLNWS